MRVVVHEGIRGDREELRKLVREAFTGIDDAGVEVRVERAVRQAQSFTGRAYAEPPARPRAAPDTRYLVRIMIPSALRNRAYPRTYRYARMRTAPWITVGDWRERFVALAAHEAYHVLQFREGLRRSEVAAERWAASVLADWRSKRECRAPVRAEPAAVGSQLCFEW